LITARRLAGSTATTTADNKEVVAARQLSTSGYFKGCFPLPPPTRCITSLNKHAHRRRRPEPCAQVCARAYNTSLSANAMCVGAARLTCSAFTHARSIMSTSGLQAFWPASCLAIRPSLVDSLRRPGHCSICHPWHGSLRTALQPLSSPQRAGTALSSPPKDGMRRACSRRQRASAIFVS
jgi:hypothetical protein